MAGLFSPLKVKEFTLRNRIVLPPMANHMAGDDGAITEAHIKHYVRRARAGVGMVIVEHSYVRRDGRLENQQTGIYDDSLVPGLRQLVEAVKACDTVVGIQITHAGGKATHESIGQQPVAPSDGVVFDGEEAARALTIEEIDTLVDDFVAAAQRAIAAGFDFVEVHCAHGYLLNQFLSPLTNLRTDEYGGDLHHRFRLPLRVVKAVREVVDDDHLLLCRLGADDFSPDGTTPQDGQEAAKALVEAGVDIVDITGGLRGYEPPDYDGTSQGFLVPLSSGIQAVVGVPVICTGGITDPKFADEVIRSGKVELVGIGRAMLKNAKWAEEARELLGPDD